MHSWNHFKHRNLWQHPLWDKFQQAIGRKTFELELPDARALVIKHALPFGLCWLEVPRGPLFETQQGLEAILKKIEVVGKKEKAVFIRLSPYQKLTAHHSPLTVSKEDKHPQTSLLIDLMPSEADILAQMKPKGRYNIKVAQKHEIKIETREKVDDFYDILVSTGGRDGFGIHPKSYYQKMLDCLGDKAQLMVAVYEGKVIAGGIFVYLEDMGIYYYGASDHEHRKFMAPYLIQWEAVKEAKKRGCKAYDFLGIAPEGAENHAWAGVTDFKKKFGGQVQDYPQAQEIVLKPFWYRLYQWKKGL